MHKRFIVFLLFITQISLFAQAPAITWLQEYGGSEIDELKSSALTTDGGYILAGASDSNQQDVSNNHGLLDFWIVKLDQQGSIQWQRSYGGSHDDIANSVKQTYDGGYIVVGNTFSNNGDVTGFHGTNTTYCDIWVLKLNSSGNIVWKKTIGTTGYDIGSDVIITSDGGYIVTGHGDPDEDSVEGYHDIFVIKLSSTGQVEWQNYYGGTYYERSYSIQQSNDGGYIIAGETYSNDLDVTSLHGSPNNTPDVWVVKLSSSGALEWNRSYGGTGYDRANCIKKTPDGGYIIAAEASLPDGDVTDIHGTAGADVWLIKINNTGNIEWQKTYGGSANDRLAYIENVGSSGYVFTAVSSSIDGDINDNYNNFGSDDAWVVKLDNQGEIQWSTNFGGNQDDFPATIFPTQDHGYFIAGWTNSFEGDIETPSGWIDYWVIKLNSDPLSIEEFNEQEFAVYPNPSFNEIKIKPCLNIKPEKIAITDISGKTIKSINFNSNVINVEDLQPGMYFVHIYAKNQHYKSKFIKN